MSFRVWGLKPRIRIVSGLGLRHQKPNVRAGPFGIARRSQAAAVRLAVGGGDRERWNIAVCWQYCVLFVIIIIVILAFLWEGFFAL